MRYTGDVELLDKLGEWVTMSGYAMVTQEWESPGDGRHISRWRFEGSAISWVDRGFEKRLSEGPCRMRLSGFPEMDAVLSEASVAQTTFGLYKATIRFTA